ncbi:MAG: FRG domain-containing protein [Clostridiales bacterium]|nr:FRG domain-containing protein [Clostridiales bacterium]
MEKEQIIDTSQLLIERLNELVQKNNYVFRGYSKQDELLPALIRDNDYSSLEIDFLKEFEKYGSPYFHATTPIDFLSYAQHFGIPTRLLDFTFNPYVALCFALFSSKGPNYKNPEDKEYYYIRVASIKDNYKIDRFTFERETMIGPIIQPDTLCDKTEVIINCIKNNDYDGFHIKEFNNSTKYLKKILFVDPSKSNQRITMQQGLFMLPYDIDKDIHIDIIKENTYVIKIPKSLRTELLSILDTLGFNTYRLMPDLQSVCVAITKNVKERNQQKKNIDFLRFLNNEK